MDKQVFLETRQLSKRFNDITAVHQVSLNIRLGEIRGLIGENGSGKSTISAMISGMLMPSGGEMLIDGVAYRPKSMLDAREHNISMIVQETGTIPELSVAENMFLGEEKRFAKRGMIDHRRMNQEAEQALAAIGLQEIDVTRPMHTLGFEQRKLTEIARALYYDPSLFIVDETTTALSHEGRMLIHQIMRRLRDSNKAVLFISHDLPELMEVCDVLTVMRDGSLITAIDKPEFDEEHIKQSMVGRIIEGNYYRTDHDGSHGAQAVISVRNASTSILKEIELELHEGEILGIGGLSGSGMHELGQLMYGGLKPESGQVMVYNRPEDGSLPVPRILNSIKTAMDSGIGYVSKDRDKETLIMEASIKDNLVLSALDQLARFGLIMPGAEKRFAGKQMAELQIKASSMNQSVGELSGGNKQKVSFGKWIGNHSRILILDSPTRGVDVGVKTTMYQLLYALKLEGYSILMISEELPELIGMSDRILMMRDGRIRKEFSRMDNPTEAMLIGHMI
ncbi:sugar ABC transporter ATP-binding protein [Paenibacillus sp. MMS20-IR301]|uniref:sugar ABC transporter ATP-binding protein n=1 Tax=Paenibacillus sp. MMS20-IR301 TaxID=2895946 RepID=UPI0028E818B7|nr:sugar ABC transporter ATP-binding protein [Paenibacillus sp. MMS20-IR301]WNS46677.1 sugar ABC transporter ATP-binding protein [Paenibacillus sp. MMS20-IR301]